MKKEALDAINTLTSLMANCQEGDRHIVVLDRGWIFVGDLTIKDGVGTLTNCHNVRKWTGGGFGGLTKGAKSSSAVLDSCAPIRFSEDAPIFVVPVGEGWDNE